MTKLEPEVKEKPAPNITDPDFVWVEPIKTNVQDTWKRFGWTPPSEKRKA